MAYAALPSSSTPSSETGTAESASVDDSQGPSPGSGKSNHSSEDKTRFTYEHMLLRYGDWRNIRSQLLVYSLIMLLGSFLKAHGDFIDVISRLNSISNDRHIHCCCYRNPQFEYADALNHMYGNDNPYGSTVVLLASALGLSSPLWEKYFGRRRTLLLTCTIGLVCSIGFTFSTTPNSLLVWSLVAKLCTMSIFVISMATLVEMLPYKLRYLAISMYLFIGSINNGTTVLHFHFRLIENPIYLGTISVVCYAFAFYLALVYARDSIIHLIIRNKTDVVEKWIRDEEMRLYRINPSGSKDHHRKIAHDVFCELVYVDHDEIQLSYFLKRLYTNWAMTEIILAFFQSISAGLIEYEFTHFYNEHFADVYIINGVKIVGWMVAGWIFYTVHKSHRTKVLQLLFAFCIVLTCARHIIMRYDKTNKCGRHLFHDPGMLAFALITGVLAVAVGSALQTIILLHFLETAPSILRLCCAMIVYIPTKATFHLARMMFGVNGVESSATIIPVYLYHLLVIVISMGRAQLKKKLQYSLYLFDLMPQEDDDSCSEDEGPTESGEEQAQSDAVDSGECANSDEKSEKTNKKTDKSSSAKSMRSGHS